MPGKTLAGEVVDVFMLQYNLPLGRLLTTTASADICSGHPLLALFSLELVGLKGAFDLQNLEIRTVLSTLSDPKLLVRSLGLHQLQE